MRASELIERLEQLVDDNGDLEIWIDARYHPDRAAPVSTVDYDNIPTGEGETTGPVIAIIAD